MVTPVFRLFLALSLSAIIGVMGSRSAHAALFEYDYVGNNYNFNVGAPYTTDMRVNIWMSGDHPNIFNFVGDISGFISDIKITDGVQEYSSVLGNFTIFDANLVTDGAGNIVEWEMGFLLIDPASDPTEAIVTKSCGFNKNPTIESPNTIKFCRRTVYAANISKYDTKYGLRVNR